jgi:hypothetical protein
MRFHLFSAGLLSAFLAFAEPLSFDLATGPGWNLVAVPISIADDPDTRFAAGSAWEWTGARFENAETIVPGKAYWVHELVARSSRTVTGAAVDTVTRDLVPGWNLIGGIGYPPYAALPLPLSVSPPGSVSEVWGWENGEYAKLTQLAPGRGAWVFAKRNCTIRLSPNPDPVAINLAYSNGPGQMRLQWTTPTDDNSDAADFSYAIYGAPIAARDALIAPEYLLSTRMGSQSAILSGLTIDTAYTFTVIPTDGDGNTAYFHPTTNATVQGAAQTVDSSTGGELSDGSASVLLPAGYLHDPGGPPVNTVAGN